MNEILELIEKAKVEVGCNDMCNGIMEDLLYQVEHKHKQHIIAAYERGTMNVLMTQNKALEGFTLSSEQYYNRYYKQ